MYFIETLLKKGEKQKHQYVIEGVSLPIWTIGGGKEGKTLVVTAGVHGCEYVGIQAAKSLFDTIEALEIKGNLVILPLINKEGFYTGSKQVMPQDGQNLNHIFPGQQDGKFGDKLAYWIEKEIYQVADFIMDLHGGDINERMTPLVFFPASAGEEIKNETQRAAMTMPIEYRIPSSAQTGLYSYAAQKGIPSLLLEIGGSGRWSETEVTLCLSCIKGVMGHLDMIKEQSINKSQKESRQTIYEEAEEEGFWYPYITAGQEIECGQIIGELRNIEDEVITVYRAKVTGTILYYTYTLGVKKGDALIAYGATSV